MRVPNYLRAAALVFGALGCRGTEPVGGAPDFRGPVLQVGEDAGRFLLQYRPPGPSSGRIWIGVLDDTRIRRPSGAPVAAADIRRGAILSVWTSHAVLDSDPAQTAADTIVVEPAP